ncbi:MAG: hypothetical protein R6V01_06855 [Thermoplasmatota archaeon]
MLLHAEEDRPVMEGPYSQEEPTPEEDYQEDPQQTPSDIGSENLYANKMTICMANRKRTSVPCNDRTVT